MKISRFASTFLTGVSAVSLIGVGAFASQQEVKAAKHEVKHEVKHQESSSWNFDSFGSWLEEMGEGFSDSFSGPKRTAAPFKWSGKVADGKTFEVRGINGPIRATASSGSDVELVAIRSGRRSDPESVKIEVVPHAGGVTICALYPSRNESRPNECKPGGGRMSVRNNDVNVEFEIRVPGNVAFEARTVNGRVQAEVEGRAAISTVNGSIEVDAGALTEATTVNGSIRATVRNSTTSADDVKLTTVNGSVRLSLPDGVNADVSAKTVNGGITSEFDEIEVRKKWGPRSAEGRLGSGGRELALSTVNGGIRITKGQ